MSFSLAAPQFEDREDSDCCELHAEVTLAEGCVVRYSTSNPTQGIAWRRPLAGDYTITVRPCGNSGLGVADVSFRVMLKCGDQEPLEADGVIHGKAASADCFRFTVAESGRIQVCKAVPPEPTASAEAAMGSRATVLKAEY